MKPFLMIAVRDEDEAVAAEFEVVRRFGRLGPDDLVLLRAENADLPPIDLDDYSGVIVGGSPFNASDDPKTERQRRVEGELGDLVDEAIRRDFPLLGICYGVGLLTQHLGGVVDRTYGERPGAVEVTLTDAAASDPVFAGLPKSFRAFTGHKEACSLLPEGAVLLATGVNCPVQAYRVHNHVYVTQFHVELDATALAQRLTIYQHHGYFEPHELEELIAEGYAAGVGAEPGTLLANFCSEMQR